MIDETALAEAVRAEFGLRVHGLTPGGRGALGQIWRAQVEGGPDVAVKLLTEKPSESLVANEVAHTQRMAGYGVVVAASMADRSGRYLTPVAEGWVRVSEWIDGTAPDPADPLTPQALGEMLGRMHAHAGPAPGQPSGWYTQPPPMAKLVKLAATAEQGDARWAGRLNALVPTWQSLSQIRKAPGALVWCHRDLHPGNVLRTVAGRFAVLDWECLGPADPAQELASVLLHWFADHTGVLGPQIDAFLAAYRSAGGTGMLTAIDDFAMHLATRLNFLAHELETVIDPRAALGDVQRAVAEIEETVEFLPTVEVLKQAVPKT
ncbi:aminoglycoside phosphotransferase [Rhizocola hellebori]|uniref:Aminoglycoside phosphotransferase n=1 Tax=Rhizocola hellebori TaxID=1392758 RepID=A0A8J3VKX3_9ACTN|nr:phosphotransferase [Rhizocola hellebori]GIH10225.1 aminoglycoside phosphotransferase [Rhizocola hellebori]